jgi:hypothetical protein
MVDEPEIEYSPLSQSISSAGKSVNVQIYRFVGENHWVLEVVDEFNNSTVWDDPFESDLTALNEVRRTILAEGVASLIGPVNGKGEWT